MRLDRVKLRGLGPFREEVTLDLAELGDATLVAVCGDNGEGKSTLLEFAMPGAFYRTTPTQGSLRDRATARDSLLEVVVTGAQQYTVRHLIDGVSGKGESVVLDAGGKPVSGSNKVSDFDAWAAKTFPPAEVLLASTFGAQQDRGFLGASPSERKAILLRTLGIARYEAWATGASKRAASCKQALEVTRARLEETRRSGGDVAAAEVAMHDAIGNAQALDADLTLARGALAELEEKARAARDAQAAHTAHATKRRELAVRIQGLETKRADIETRIGACNRTLAQEKAIRDAAQHLGGIQKQLEELAQQHTTLSSRESSAVERQRSSRAQTDEARRHHARVTARVAELEALLAKGAEIARAERELKEYEQGLAALREGVTTAQATLDELTAATVAGAEERVQALRGGLELVVAAVSLDAAQGVAGECLEEDAQGAQDAQARPANLATARRALEQSRGLLESSERRCQQVSALARRSGELTAAREQIASLQKESSEHTEAIRRHAAQADQATADARSCAEELSRLGQRRQEVLAQADRIKPLADQLPNIGLAATRLEERRLQLAELTAELEASQWALSELGPPPEVVPVPDVAAQKAKVDTIDRQARSAHQAVAVATNKLEGARATEQKARALEEQQRTEETELGDWTRLASDLGRQGLQAAEIDGCGPELTALVNDLLHRAHGTRFTVRIDTQKLSADGKRTLEGCQVTVIDTVKGREDEGAKFSGGERVIIGEALALGLSMLACQRSGLRGITLVRDETGAALDPGNAEVYVRMLRRAAEQIGADRVLFVCHNPEVSDLADARITVAKGQLVVDAPAGRVAA